MPTDISAPDVRIVEVAARDGLQNDSRQLSTAEKLKLITEAQSAGFDRVEATSFVSPKLVPAMSDSDQLCAELSKRGGLGRASALVLNERGLMRAVHAGIQEINYVVVATNEFSVRNQGASVAEAIARWRSLRATAVENGIRTTLTVAAAFGCPFEGAVEPEQAGQVALDAVSNGVPDELAFADTIGVGVPTQVDALCAFARVNLPSIPMRFHFHNTRNSGYANALAAIEGGASSLDASLGGIGGCPFAPNATGNICSEDLIWMLETMGCRTGIDLQAVLALSSWLEDALGSRNPGLLLRAGAFPSRAGERQIR